jgi:hypothetical protein
VLMLKGTRFDLSDYCSVVTTIFDTFLRAWLVTFDTWLFRVFVNTRGGGGAGPRLAYTWFRQWQNRTAANFTLPFKLNSNPNQDKAVKEGRGDGSLLTLTKINFPYSLLALLLIFTARKKSFP